VPAYEPQLKLIAKLTAERDEAVSVINLAQHQLENLERVAALATLKAFTRPKSGVSAGSVPRRGGTAA
jgi:hypothetical protein